jgi:hypothetical protein
MAFIYKKDYDLLESDTVQLCTYVPKLGYSVTSAFRLT